MRIWKLLEFKVWEILPFFWKQTMRREGFEICVSPPRILTVKDKVTGATLEPLEEVTIDVDQVDPLNLDP